MILMTSFVKQNFDPCKFVLQNILDSSFLGCGLEINISFKVQTSI